MVWYIPQSRTNVGNGIELREDDDIFIGSGILFASEEAIAIFGIAGGHEARIFGTAVGLSAGVNLFGTADRPCSIFVGASGHVESVEGAGILMTGSGGAIENQGYVRGKTDGIQSGDVELTNRGTIEGDAIGVSGTSGFTGTTETINAGTIRGGSASYDSLDTDGIFNRDLLTNTGLMVGRINLGGGDDLYEGRSGHVRGAVSGGDGADTIRAGTDDDVLDGGSGNDLLDGGIGIDRMIGGTGSDLFYVDTAGDLVFETAGGGSDTVAASTSYTLRASQSIEVLQTTSTAGTTAISLAGNEISQVVKGNNGGNVLYGRGGSDVLYGYGGADTFVFDTAPGASNRDTIADFSHAADTIRLDRTFFPALTVGNLAASAFKDIGVAAADSNDRILYNSDTGALFYDANGSAAGGAVQFGTLLTRPTDIDHLDFVIVA